MSKAVNTSTTGLPAFGAATSINRLRRALLTGSAAAVATMATGVAVSAGTASASPDAELVGLCAEFDALERRIDALFEGVSALDFDAADAAACVIEVDQRRVLDRICTLTPTTDEGCRAVARSLAVLAPDYGLPNVYVSATMDERLANLLARGMMGRAGA
jgi:hypothetical protein